jgi:hypothetical protein
VCQEDFDHREMADLKYQPVHMPRSSVIIYPSSRIAFYHGEPVPAACTLPLELCAESVPKPLFLRILCEHVHP